MVKNCRLSNLKLKKIFDFGKQPLGNGFLKKKDFNKEFFFRMEIGFCNKSKLVAKKGCYSSSSEFFLKNSPIQKECNIPSHTFNYK